MYSASMVNIRGRILPSVDGTLLPAVMDQILVDNRELFNQSINQSIIYTAFVMYAAFNFNSFEYAR